MKHQTGVANPTRHDSPCELQPPPLLGMSAGCSKWMINGTHWKDVKTCDAGAWSAMIQRVHTKAKKLGDRLAGFSRHRRGTTHPKMCTKRMMPSASGRCCAKKALNPIVSRTNNQTKSVVFHRAPTLASGWTRSTISCTMPASWIAQAGMPATQPKQLHQPTT